MITFNISDQLLDIRRKNNWTQKHLARILKTDINNISAMERGKPVSEPLIAYYNKQSLDINLESRNPMSTTSTLYENKFRATTAKPVLDFSVISAASKYFSPEKGGSYKIKSIADDLTLTGAEMMKLLNTNGIGTYCRDQYFPPKSEEHRKLFAELLNILMLSQVVFKGKDAERRLWLRLPNADFEYQAPVLANRQKVIDYLKRLA